MNKSKGNNIQSGSFLPAEYVKGKSQIRANIIALMLFTLVLAGVVGAFVVTHQRWNRVHAEQELVAQEFEAEATKIQQLKDLEAKRIELIERAEIVTALKDRVPRSVLLGEIIRSIPEGMKLTTIELDGERVKVVAPKKDPKAAPKTKSLKGKAVGKGKDNEKEEKPKPQPPKFKFALAIEGVANENDLVADFLSSLKGSPLFGDVELPFIVETTLDKEKYRKFRVTMTLLPDADARLVEGVSEVDIGSQEFGVAGTSTDSE